MFNQREEVSLNYPTEDDMLQAAREREQSELSSELEMQRNDWLQQPYTVRFLKQLLALTEEYNLAAENTVFTLGANDSLTLVKSATLRKVVQYARTGKW